MTMNNKSKTKPCPFCGNKFVTFQDNEDDAFISCLGCCASIAISLEELYQLTGDDPFNDTIAGCNAYDHIVQPLVVKWNTRV